MATQRWRDRVIGAAAFTPDGWLHRGDPGHRGSDGFCVTGRIKDLITKGAENVALRCLKRTDCGQSSQLAKRLISCSRYVADSQCREAPRSGFRLNRPAIAGLAENARDSVVSTQSHI